MIYVDHIRIPYGRMRMNHLVTDTSDELEAIAIQLGLYSHIQKRGEPGEHLDVSESKRREALALGATPVSPQEIVKIIVGKRPSAPAPPGAPMDVGSNLKIRQNHLRKTPCFFLQEAP